MLFQNMKEHIELRINEVKESVRPSRCPLSQLQASQLDISNDAPIDKVLHFIRSVGLIKC
jgi:hypothetical protein